jgi:hypothetical protein
MRWLQQFNEETKSEVKIDSPLESLSRYSGRGQGDVNRGGFKQIDIPLSPFKGGILLLFLPLHYIYPYEPDI